PGVAENPVGAARGHGGTDGDDGRGNAAAAASVHAAGDAKSAASRRNVSAAGSAAGSFVVPPAHRISGEGGGDGAPGAGPPRPADRARETGARRRPADGHAAG